MNTQVTQCTFKCRLSLRSNKSKIIFTLKISADSFLINVYKQKPCNMYKSVPVLIMNFFCLYHYEAFLLQNCVPQMKKKRFELYFINIVGLFGVLCCLFFNYYLGYWLGSYSFVPLHTYDQIKANSIKPN